MTLNTLALFEKHHNTFLPIRGGGRLRPTNTMASWKDRSFAS